MFQVATSEFNFVQLLTGNVFFHCFFVTIDYLDALAKVKLLSIYLLIGAKLRNYVLIKKFNVYRINHKFN